MAVIICTYGGGASNYLSTEILDYFLSSGPYYVSCNSADPGVDNTTALGNEAFTGTRPQVTWTVASARRIYNLTDMIVSPSGSVTHWSLWDSATVGAGNLIASGELDRIYTANFTLRPYDLGISLDPYDTRLKEVHPYDYTPTFTV